MKNHSVLGRSALPVKLFTYAFPQYRLLSLSLFLSFSLFAGAQVAPDDLAEAEMLSKTYKDEQVVCRSSYHYFTFDKGKNSFNDKVVVVQEDAEMEFLSLKKYSSVTY